MTFYEVSEKPLKYLSETSDYTDFKKIKKIFYRVSHLCNRYLIFLIRELCIFLNFFKSSLIFIQGSPTDYSNLLYRNPLKR